jgi:PAS domain S-box-containing protein
MTRVLIVDDKEPNIYYLQALLTGNGCTVESARHGAEALVLARQNPPDLVVSDLLMPIMDGYTLLRHWKADARLKKVPFIVYTATYTEEEDERLALNLGADAFILKPAEPEDFLARLRAIQANATAAVPQAPKSPTGDEKALLKVYSETLIRKLEEKTLELEESNRALQRDIAARTKIESALRESIAQFRLLAETIPHIVWIARPDGWHEHFNQRWLDYTGLTMEESIGHGCSPSFHPEDRAEADRRWQAATASGKTYEIEYRLRRRDGVYHWMLGRALPLRDATGTIVKWLGTCTDIEELKQAQARISEQAALLDQTQDAIMVRDLDHRILYWNKGAERIYGWTAAEAIGRNARELFNPDPGPHSGAQELLLRDGEWSGELHHVTKTGTPVIMEGRWTLLRDDHGAPKSVLAISTDVTERRRLEHQFLRAQRMESIGTLAGGIAHDLNNLLSPILMGVGLLRQSQPNAEDERVLTHIERSAQRGAELVKQVLSFSRGVEGARVAVHLGHIIREVELIAQNTFPKNITIETDVARDLALVTGDPTQLNQVLLNLGVNARDAMPNGGRLGFSARNTRIDEQQAALPRGLTSGRYVLVEVTDTGCGMTQEIVDRIFEPFYTTKELGKGTGLGLSTALGIVRSHRGCINVTSETGRGSTFQIFLPVQTISAAPAPAAAEPVALPRGRGELILVVDDEATILGITRQTLESFGYRVITAGDGAEAMGLYALRRHEIALVLTDLMMPVMDGATLIAALRRIDPGVRFIAMSGNSAPAAEGRAAESGVKHFLPKPFPADRLVQLLHQILTEESGLATPDPHGRHGSRVPFG